MDDTQTTVLLGIPIPSTDPFFLGIVVVHIGFGILATVAGAIAMLSPKGGVRHVRFGTLYFWALSGVVLTMSALSILHWSENRHLFALGLLAFVLAATGRLAIRRAQVRLHLAGMALSYIVMLTAFYVDNGKNLPLWRELPPLAYWIVPSLIGLPLLARYLWRLPQIRKDS